MAYQTVMDYLSGGVGYMNSILASPVKFVQSKLSLQTNTLPQSTQSPVNFTLILVLMILLIMSYTSNLVCNVFGIGYPIMYTTQGTKPEMTATLNKYWVIFGSMTLVDNVAGAFLNNVPGYYYVKLAFIYALIRNDFALTNTVYGVLESYYKQVTVLPIVEKYFYNIEDKIKLFFNKKSE